jgi:hypothetical protein
MVFVIWLEIPELGFYLIGFVLFHKKVDNHLGIFVVMYDI